MMVFNRRNEDGNQHGHGSEEITSEKKNATSEAVEQAILEEKRRKSRESSRRHRQKQKEKRDAALLKQTQSQINEDANQHRHGCEETTPSKKNAASSSKEEISVTSKRSFVMLETEKDKNRAIQDPHDPINRGESREEREQRLNRDRVRKHRLKKKKEEQMQQSSQQDSKRF